MMSAYVVRRLGLCGLIAVLWSGAAQAIVNIEGQRSGSAGPGLSGALNLSLSGAQGNADKFATTAGGRLLWQRQHSSTLLIASYSYGASNDVRDTNKTFAHLREVIPRNERNSLEAFFQVERNEFTRLTLRTLIGAGLRHQLHGDDSGETRVGVGAFYSTEKLDDNALYTDTGTEYLWRGNVYLAVDYQIKAGLKVESTTYYQPALDDSADFRLLEQAAARFMINNHLALSLSLDIAHDSRPPQSVKQTDINYLSGLEYSFD